MATSPKVDPGLTEPLTLDGICSIFVLIEAVGHRTMLASPNSSDCDSLQDAIPSLEPPPARPSAGQPLAALSGATETPRFLGWRGASGRRYVFSVFECAACPDYNDAILIIARIAAGGQRSRIAILDTGAFAGPLLRRLAKSYELDAANTEFQLHLLANSAAERRDVIRDIQAAD